MGEGEPTSRSDSFRESGESAFAAQDNLADDRCALALKSVVWMRRACPRNRPPFYSGNRVSVVTVEISIGDSGLDWPAWVQAVGSILAILVSAFFAIWVPLQMRGLQAADLAMRDQRYAALVAAKLMGQASEMQKQAVAGERLSRYAEQLARGELEACFRLLNEVGFDRLGVKAITAVTTLRVNTSILLACVEGLCVEPIDGQVTIAQLAGGVRTDARAVLDVLGSMRVRKAFRLRLLMADNETLT